MQNWRFPPGDAVRNLLAIGRRAALPGVVAAMVVTGLLKLGVLQPLEQRAYNWLFQLRGTTRWDDRVVVIAVDENSLKELGRFPLSRQRYAELLQILTQARASTVVLDALLPDSSPEDVELAARMTEQGRVILPRSWDANGEPLLPTPVLREAAVAEGHIEIPPGMTQTIVPQIQNLPMLGIAAAQIYSLVKEPITPPDLNQPLWLNWTGSASQIPTYPLLDVLSGRVTADRFSEKIVVVGTTATVSPIASPYDRSLPPVYLHATTIHNILQRNFLRVPATPWVIVGLLLGGIGLSIGMKRLTLKQQVMTLIGLSLGWSIFSVLLLRANLLMPVASPIALFAGTTAALAFARRAQEESLFQQEVERLWKTYRQGLIHGATPHPPEALPPQSVLAMRMTQLATLAEQFSRSQSTQFAISRSLSIGLVAADLDGWVWFCNPIAAQCLGVLVGDRLQSHLIPDWYQPEAWLDSIDNLRQHMPLVPHEVARDDRWFEIRLEPLSGEAPTDPLGQLPGWDDAGKVEGMLLLLEDITARKQVEENLNQQMQELQRINHLKDDFLNTVSHEMRAPLTNMSMAIRMLQMAVTDEQRQKYLQVLEGECLRETNLIEDLLSLQQLEAGAKELSLEEINLPTWLPTLLEPFQQRVQSRQLRLRLRLSPQLPRLVSDRSSLERILTELVNNACKYTPPEGEITVTVDAMNDWTQFIVNNSGVEIPAAEINKVFDKFYRVASGDRWKQGGTGLGLALVKKLVEQLGGNIHLTSQFEQTTFTVQIPTRQQPPNT
jgi:signal transduction histidine kinase/CHASE2 domain-containing sensor protein